MRKSICINIDSDDLDCLDYLCEYLSAEYCCKYSRTSTIKFLINRYYGDVFNSSKGNKSLDDLQIKLHV